MKETIENLKVSLKPVYGERETKGIIREIFHYLKGWDLTEMLIHQGDELSPFIKQQIEEIKGKLLNHEPIQYITGNARFHGMDFKVTRDTLIPRPETDELVDLIIEQADNRSDLKILDIGTGSGCIAISLARNLKFPDVMALDFSPDALMVAEENARNLKVKVKFILANIFEWQPTSKFDIIVSNPPYVTEKEKKDMEPGVLDYEPESALFVPDDDPLRFYKRIADIALSSLEKGGRLYLEINPLFHVDLVRLLKDKGFVSVKTDLDISGKVRFITAIKDD